MYMCIQSHTVCLRQGGTLFTVLCNYSPLHKYTTLPPTVMMVIQVYSRVCKVVLYVDERAYEQFCNKLWHRSVFCGVSHTIYTDC